MMLGKLSLLVVSCWVVCATAEYLPVVLWHGMGDCCCNPLSMGHIKKVIEEQHEGTYVYSIMIGDNVIQDTENGFFMNVNDQIEEACQKIRADPKLANGYHAAGFSQGGQFLRALVQRCNSPQMHNLVTFGGQHQGVFGFPHCPLTNSHCENMRQMLTIGAYNSYVQDHLVQAEYWHDPLNETVYKEENIFIAEINQEKGINETYRTNLQALDNFAMVLFLNDSVVIPRESAWFGFYSPGQDVLLQTLQESKLYTEDWLGLKAMNEAGKVQFLSTEGDHLQFTDEWFIQNIVDVYFN